MGFAPGPPPRARRPPPACGGTDFALECAGFALECAGFPPECAGFAPGPERPPLARGGTDFPLECMGFEFAPGPPPRAERPPPACGGTNFPLECAGFAPECAGFAPGPPPCAERPPLVGRAPPPERSYESHQLLIVSHQLVACRHRDGCRHSGGQLDSRDLVCFDPRQSHSPKKSMGTALGGVWAEWLVVKSKPSIVPRARDPPVCTCAKCPSKCIPCGREICKHNKEKYSCKQCKAVSSPHAQSAREASANTGCGAPSAKIVAVAACANINASGISARGVRPRPPVATTASRPPRSRAEQRLVHLYFRKKRQGSAQLD